jgi:signal transduction histidine kinase
LTDRGLAAAVSALAADNPLPVSLDVDGDERLGAAVESAAYFVVAEALTNASKHAGATACGIRLIGKPTGLSVSITDDGRGGADPRGLGLDGLRRRVEALDGTFDVESPTGGPTVIRAELPCAS